MITISSRLQLSLQDAAILDLLMNRWSAAYHTAFNQLISGKSQQEIVQSLKTRFDLGYKYAYYAFLEAKWKIAGCKELDVDPSRIIFGGRKRFKQLKKRHIDDHMRASIKAKYREARRFNLFSIGDKATKGNLNTRIENDTLRIKVGDRQHVWATIHTSDKRWAKRNTELYTVRITKRGGKYYAHFSFEEVGLPPVACKFDDGCIAIDMNAKPAHIAWVELDHDGNLKDRGEIQTPMLYDQRSHVRDHYVYVYAKQLAEICATKNKGLVLEKLGKLPRDSRATSNFCYAKLTKAIEVVCTRGGIATKQVNPAYTSVLGCLKYAPILNLSRHHAAAIVIGRRGLGLKDRLPKHMESLATPQESSSVSVVNPVGVPRWKKEANYHRECGRVYKVVRAALLGAARGSSLTGRSSGPSWSMLRKFVLHGTDARFNDKLGPLSVGGLRLRKKTASGSIKMTHTTEPVDIVRHEIIARLLEALHK